MNYSEKLKQKLENGASFEEALFYLRSSNATPIETIKAIKEVKNIGLREAKELFACSKAWRDIAIKADKMHEKLIDAIDKDL